eukprot:sb/3473860/
MTEDPYNFPPGSTWDTTPTRPLSPNLHRPLSPNLHRQLSPAHSGEVISYPTDSPRRESVAPTGSRKMTLGDLGRMLKSPRSRRSTDPIMGNYVPPKLKKRGSYKRATAEDGSESDTSNSTVDVLSEVTTTAKKKLLKRMSNSKRW